MEVEQGVQLPKRSLIQAIWQSKLESSRLDPDHVKALHRRSWGTHSATGEYMGVSVAKKKQCNPEDYDSKGMTEVFFVETCQPLNFGIVNIRNIPCHTNEFLGQSQLVKYYRLHPEKCQEVVGLLSQEIRNSPETVRFQPIKHGSMVQAAGQIGAFAR